MQLPTETRHQLNSNYNLGFAFLTKRRVEAGAALVMQPRNFESSTVNAKFPPAIPAGIGFETVYGEDTQVVEFRLITCSVQLQP